MSFFSNLIIQPPKQEMIPGVAMSLVIDYRRRPNARRYILRVNERGDGGCVTIPRGGSWAEARRFARRNAAWLEQRLRQHQERASRMEDKILFRGELLPLAEVFAKCAPQTAHLAIANNNLEGESPSLPRSGGEGRGEDALIAKTSDLVGEIKAPLSSFLPARPSQGEREEGRSRAISSRVGPQSPVRASIDNQSGALEMQRTRVHAFLRKLAERELPLRTHELAVANELTVRRVSVRDQRSRWGSCSVKGVISLNWRLVQTPEFVRDYIIVHELMHLREMNHSAKFWKHVHEAFPRTDEAEHWLKANGGLLRAA